MKNTVRVSVCSTRTHIIFLACKGGVKHPLAKNHQGVEVHLCLKWLWMEANLKDSFHIAVSGHMIEYANKDHSRMILSVLRNKLRSRSKQPYNVILTTT